MDVDEYRQRDHEYGEVYEEALKLQQVAEKAGMTVAAQQARAIRAQARLRLRALNANRPTETSNH